MLVGDTEGQNSNYNKMGGDFRDNVSTHRGLTGLHDFLAEGSFLEKETSKLKLA